MRYDNVIYGTHTTMQNIGANDLMAVVVTMAAFGYLLLSSAIIHCHFISCGNLKFSLAASGPSGVVGYQKK